MFSRAVIFVAAFLLSVPTYATCLIDVEPTTTAASPAALCALHAAASTAANPSSSYTCTGVNTVSHTYHLHLEYDIGGGPVTVEYDFGYTCDDECDFEHKADDGNGLTITGTGAYPTGNFCGPITHCKIAVTGPIISTESTWMGKKTVVNAACDGDETSGSPTPAGGTCMTGGGNMSCQSGSGCGTVNGDYVCPSSAPAGSCKTFASGGSMCVVDAMHPAASPPAPNNGTPGTPATPSVSITNTTTNSTANYFNGSVTAASTTPVIGGPGTTAIPGEDPTSEAGDASLPGLESNDIETSTNVYVSAVQASPIVAAFSNIAGSIPSGTCPTPTIVLFGATHSFSTMCSLFADVASTISAFMLAVWVILGVRIVMSA